jgi:tRNA (guanine37-N1)-methyltransferase
MFEYCSINIRDFALDSHKSVDDHPYGGGAGMVLKPDILERALLYAFSLEGIETSTYNRDDYSVLITSASGEMYTQSHAQKLSHYKALFIVCGHYEGIDQRFIDVYADLELRVGNYVLTGGELASLIISDSIIRLLPDALGSPESIIEESFSFSDQNGVLLEYPHYTRPQFFHELPVPDVLQSGNHARIKEWRLAKSQELRAKRG